MITQLMLPDYLLIAHSSLSSSTEEIVILEVSNGMSVAENISSGTDA
jgi:hypothetical protein